MSQILLFTNNPLNEQLFERRLRQLGHEVYTTKLLIDRCLSARGTSDVLRIFDHIILSETLSNGETKRLLQALKGAGNPLLRKSDEQLEEAQLEEWKRLGLTGWIESRPSLEVLREALSCGEKGQIAGEVIVLPKSDGRQTLSSLNLSRVEDLLFRILYEKQHQPVSREEICSRLWNRGNTNSSKSQLSVLVKYLRNKLAGKKITGPIIETCWGKGYRLHETVYDQIFIDDPSVKRSSV
ncbi:MAG: helix-turn-helix domain-containing protein [Enterococcus gilvus]